MAREMEKSRPTAGRCSAAAAASPETDVSEMIRLPHSVRRQRVRMPHKKRGDDENWWNEGRRKKERKPPLFIFLSFPLRRLDNWSKRERSRETSAEHTSLLFFSFFLFFKTNDEVVKLEYAVQSEIEHILGLPMTTAESNDSR